MVNKLRGRTIMEHAAPTEGGEVHSGRAVTATTANGVVAVDHTRLMRKVRLMLTNFTVTDLGANDYGSLKLCDLPNTALLFVGAVVNLTAAGTGGVDTIANLDVAVGTVATATTAFSNAGEKNLCPKIDVSSGGVCQGQSTSSETNVFITAGSSNSVYLNIGDVISTDGTVVFNGYVELFYYDLNLKTNS